MSALIGHRAIAQVTSYFGMIMSLFKLDNTVQNYEWGSRTAINELFGFANPANEPQAEIWMGAHNSGCSMLSDTGERLADVIQQDKLSALGNYTTERFGGLPFLFKVLAAEKPLSIQVHPNKRKSELGFARENEAGIALTAANRNYKDDNHKPELVYALTFYKAMNGFRPIEQILLLFKEVKISELSAELECFIASPNSDGLKTFFEAIMTLEGSRKQRALSELRAAYHRPVKTLMTREALEYSRQFDGYYEGDIGLFSPLLLNTIELAPGEAMFLFAETPHAYVQGTALEVMASSDNVLRAGLTNKHIDVAELVDNTCFESTDPDKIRMQPIEKVSRACYPIPVDDFAFDIIESSDEMNTQYVRGPEILFCIEGEVTVKSGDRELVLKPADSVFLPCDSVKYDYSGEGRLARAYN